MPGPNDHHVVFDTTVPSGHRLESGLGADEPPEELRRGASRASVLALKKLKTDAEAEIAAATELQSQLSAKEKQLAKDRADFELERATFLASQGAAKSKEK